MMQEPYLYVGDTERGQTSDSGARYTGRLQVEHGLQASLEICYGGRHGTRKDAIRYATRYDATMSGNTGLWAIRRIKQRRDEDSLRGETSSVDDHLILPPLCQKERGFSAAFTEARYMVQNEDASRARKGKTQ